MMAEKTALVLGATGGIGGAVAKRLMARGWSVRALHRHPRQAAATGPYEWIQGDALVATDVAMAARDVSLIVHAVKPRLYRDWHQLVLPMIDNTLAAAHGARVLVPGNVYNYGPDAGLDLHEDAPQHPSTAKGKLRVAMERRIEDAVLGGNAKALIVRAGDFFGPGAGSSWFSELMVKPGRRPRVVRNPACPDVGHQWVYLPDLAETMVQLAEHGALPDFARYHMDGHWDHDGRQMATAIVQALGWPDIRITRFPWWLVRVAAPFSRTLKEVAELRYLWERPVRLRNERLIATVGREPHTPLPVAVRSTLMFLGQQPVEHL